MTHFRFRYKRVGYMRWRCRAARHRTTLLLLPLTPAARHVPSQAAWRRPAPVQLPATPQPLVLRVGHYVVSEQGDPQISGHPDIRY
ncbi:hypothetical protein [Hymenobacter antarcticus]|uniref:Uncharacterized protein n=1 Tax=Hymenobacter antarcticus TaxID=486270 RepID=A0ABP7P0Q6_9BACT